MAGAGGGKADKNTHRIRVGAFEVRKVGAKTFDPRDPYHLALTVRWPTFIAWLFGSYAVITVIYALIYLANPGAVTNTDPGSFGDVLFFSFETLASSGYGEMAPANGAGRVIATAEIVTGMAFMCIMTGLVFVRFSRPKAKILFADKAVVTMHNGKPTLMLRVGNGRPNALTDAVSQLNVMVRETTKEGMDFFNVHELKLTRSKTPFFPLTMTLMHEIAPAGPLAGISEKMLAEKRPRLFLSIEARDPSLASSVNDLRTYAHDEIALNSRYIDTISTDEDGRPVADLTKISLIEPDGEKQAR